MDNKKIIKNIKNAAMIIGAILVAAVIIAGETLGWRTFLPSFSSPSINIAPTSRPPSEAFFADEKLWVTLSDAETDRVYWVFDESDDVIAGSIQLQYTFPFNSKLPHGTTSKRRVDAFYKIGDDYKHVATRVPVRNIKIVSDSSFGPQGLIFMLPAELLGEWKLGKVRLLRLSKGEFKDLHIEAETSIATSGNTRIVWNSKQVASNFGYASSEEAGLKLMSDRTAWVSAEYKGQNAEETLTVIKPIGEKVEL